MSDPVFRLHQHATRHGWPHGIRVLLARPGAYHVARCIWGWSRRDAALEATACLFNRAYLRGPAGEARRRIRRAEHGRPL